MYNEPSPKTLREYGMNKYRNQIKNLMYIYLGRTDEKN